MYVCGADSTRHFDGKNLGSPRQRGYVVSEARCRTKISQDGLIHQTGHCFGKLPDLFRGAGNTGQDVTECR